MKNILITIVAVLLVGCGPQPPDISIHNAASGGHIAAIKQHLAAGTDVNAKDDDQGRTPLHWANSTKEIADLLIAEGANVNAKTKFGETPIDAAILLGQTETADFLRKHGGKTGEELKAEEK